MVYECTDEVMSVLPLADVLDMPSGDNGGRPVIGVMDWKMADSWFPGVVESILRDGFTKGIIINGQGWVMDGHHRIAAAMELGLAYIPVQDGRWAEYDHAFFVKVKSGEFGKEVAEAYARR